MRATPRFDTLARHIFPEQRAGELFLWEYHSINEGGVFYHYHPQFELNLIETPRARRVVGDDEQPIRGCELVLISPNLPHRWDLESDHAKFWVVAFSVASLGTELLGRVELEQVRTLLASGERGVVFGEETCRAAAPLVKQLGEREGIHRVVTLLELFALLCDDDQRRPIASAGYHASGVQADYQLIARIVERFAGETGRVEQRTPSLAEAADMARMSVPTFTRFFRRMTGDSFVSYINRIRIARACTLLEETRNPIVEVAAEAGFGNLSHFNRQFRSHTGMQPRSYRSRKQNVSLTPEVSL
ncbi:MAG: helix-turn-helix domain-containing protein [Spirochaetales bacterium]